MNDDQFNELLAYAMLAAVNTTQLLFQQNHQRSLTEEEVDACQSYTLRAAQKLKESLAARNPAHEWAPIFDVPLFGRADT